MSSLYIHIPFCHHKCLYCNFCSTPRHFDKNLYTDCLIKEMASRSNFTDKKLQTIYFGGGTPSLLSLQQTEKIFAAIQQTYDISGTKEITFETNAEDAEINYLKELKNIGINRLSIGIQSFNDRDLRLLNRSHSSYQAKKAVENAFNAGFCNISVDLISNLPWSSFEVWKENIRTLLSFDIPHISCYTLMTEEGTMLYRLMQQGKYSPLDEKQALQQLDYTMQTLEDNGYIHYETSSYAKDGYFSQHNMAYWTFQPYIGIGTAAHSYNGKVRMWNEDDVWTYTDRIMHNDYNGYPQQEILSLKDCYNEYIMLSARMKNALNTEYVQKHFPEYYVHFTKQLNKLIQWGFIMPDYTLTTKGWHLQDTLITYLAV